MKELTARVRAITIKLMTSDHLGTRIAAAFQPGELAGNAGHTFGLGLQRQSDGIAGVSAPRASSWAGYAGTFSG
jgi:hypothetical protein